MHKGRHLREVSEFDALTWDALLEHGMVEGSPLAVDTYFLTDGEQRARSLAIALSLAGCAASVQASRERLGFLRRRTDWSVQSTRVLPEASLAAVADHSEAMIRLAAERGAQYDGWDAGVPAP